MGLNVFFNDAVKNIETTFNKAKDGVVDVVEKAADGVTFAYDKTREGIENAADKVREDIHIPEIVNHSLDDELRNNVDAYNASYSRMNDRGIELHDQREKSIELIVEIEALINSIANRPKEFDKELAEVEIKRTEFKKVCDFAKEEFENAKKNAIGAGTGIAAGSVVAALAPTGALWIATTFGTASTGVAISTLSGVAATNAALAWLGGGALAAGGGGMLAGNALLALAGPIGWGIAGVSLGATAVMFVNNKNKLNKEKSEQIEQIKKEVEKVNEISESINSLLQKTQTLRSELDNQYHQCLEFKNADFSSLQNEEKLKLGTLVNNTKSLASSLMMNV